MSETRLDEIETRLAHQEKTISDLNDVVLGQWRRIEALERQLSRMNEEMQNMDSGALPVDKPPHY
ncbi:MAG: SlyX family protein [Aestuariivirga sp.]